MQSFEVNERVYLPAIDRSGFVERVDANEPEHDAKIYEIRLDKSAGAIETTRRHLVAEADAARFEGFRSGATFLGPAKTSERTIERAFERRGVLDD